MRAQNYLCFPKPAMANPRGTHDSLFSALQFQKLLQLRGLGSCRRPVQAEPAQKKELCRSESGMVRGSHAVGVWPATDCIVQAKTRTKFMFITRPTLLRPPGFPR